ncbi:MAG TPA: aminotransferase class I/II-fold pyridoxal phosphate-dependent enzyme [Streptosporangiaceae bacterium]|nr:aminotransferase class I/II-fold pyridoxal phosphate-dependent enzyme [Streptosporangiaceae bacterium]
MAPDAATVSAAFKRRAVDPRINLSSNELLHPRIDELLTAALSKVTAEAVRRYPATTETIGIIGDRFGLNTDEFIVTPGSDSALRSICRGYVAAHGTGGRLLLQYPNYDAWEQVAAECGLPVQRVRSPAGDGAEQAELLLAAARSRAGALIAVSTPNGPVGWSLPSHRLDELCEVAGERGHLLVIDACYQAFDGELTRHLRRRGDRVLVVQSLSKSHGLAGARMALLAGAPERVRVLAEGRLEHAVSGATMLVAGAVLDQPRVLAQIWADVKAARTEAAGALRILGLSPMPSGGNFVTVRVGSPARAKRAARRLSLTGYRVRDLSPLDGLGGCLRFTVGDLSTTRAALAALRAALAD